MTFCKRCEWPVLVDPDAQILADLAGEPLGEPTCWNGCHLDVMERPDRREPVWAVPSAAASNTDLADHLYGIGQWGTDTADHLYGIGNWATASRAEVWSNNTRFTQAGAVAR